MRLIRRSTVVAVLAVVAGAVPALAAPDTGADEALLRQAAHEFIQHRADTLVTGKATAHGVASLAGGAVLAGAQVSAAEATASTELAARRERLAAAGERYSAARTEITSVEAAVRAKTAELVVVERTTLDYLRVTGDEPADTAFAAERTFRFTRDGGRWVLREQALAAEGPLPVTEPAVPATPVAPPADGAAVDKPANPSSDKVTVAAYNYQAMANYALKHVFSYNTAYRRYSDVGGDCTNFISQALRAGGWAHVSGWYRDYRHWWYNSLNETWSWINVNSWASFARHSGRTSHLGNVWSLGLADILQMDFTSNGSKDHSMIVTLRTSTMPYLSYHTTDTKNRSLQSLLDAYRGATYYAFRT